MLPIGSLKALRALCHFGIASTAAQDLPCFLAHYLKALFFAFRAFRAHHFLFTHILLAKEVHIGHVVPKKQSFDAEYNELGMEESSQFGKGEEEVFGFALLEIFSDEVREGASHALNINYECT